MPISASRAETTLNLISEKLVSAPFQPGDWAEALGLLAEATGSSHGQLIGWNGPYGTPFNLITNLSDDDAEIVSEWETGGGADPAQNPMVRRGLRSRTLEVVSDDEIVSRDERRNQRVWRDYFDRLDVPHMCFTPVWQDDNAQLILAVLRSRAEGVIGNDQRRMFAASAARFEAAAMTARALKTEAGCLLAGAFDNLSIAAIVVNRFGHPIAMSGAAEKAFENGDYLRLGKGELCDAQGKPIQFRPAIEPPRRAFAIRLNGPGGVAATLRISPLPPNAQDLGFGAAAMIVLEIADGVANAELPHHIASLLTPAEQAVAIGLLAGERPAQIAERRGVAVETVRTHIKRVYAKTNVSGALEFLAKARE